MSSRGLLWLGLAVLCASLRASGASDGEVSPDLIAAEKAYHAAKARYQTNANDDTAARQWASACFDVADLTSKESVRVSVSHEGVQVCRRWVERRPDQAAAHYFLGMNLAQLARTKSLGALPLVREMEKEWLTTLLLDPHFDHGGADRNLGVLYRDAPGFPLSIGSRAKAEQHLQHALELNPEYPENLLSLIETHLKRKPAAVAGEYEKLRALLPAARKQFNGPAWQSSWTDWDARLKAIQSKLPAAP